MAKPKVKEDNPSSFRANVYGIHVDVVGPASEYFAKELSGLSDADLQPFEHRISVIPSDHPGMPTRPAGSRAGFSLPFGKPSLSIEYNPDVDPYVLFSYAEAFFSWQSLSFLHAGAVSVDGEAYIFTGTGGVGKTSAVLNLVARGYHYLADDWLIVGNGTAYPYPKRVHIFDYNIADPQIRRRVLGMRRYGYLLLYRAIKIAQRLAPHRLVRFALEQAKPRFQVPIQTLIPGSQVGKPSRVKQVFYLIRGESAQSRTFEVDPSELAWRMAAVNRYERDFFFREFYHYASTNGVRDPTVESRCEQEYRVLRTLFSQADLLGIELPKNNTRVGEILAQQMER